MDRKNSPRIGCVVMAAGTEQARLLRVYDGKALLSRALDAVPPELAGDTVVVASGEGVAELARAQPRAGCKGVVGGIPAQLAVAFGHSGDSFPV